MPIVACPNCQNKLQVPDAGPRRQVRCPGCQTLFLASSAERVDKGGGPSRRARIDVPRAAGEPDPDDVGWEPVEDEEAAPSPRRRADEADDAEPDVEPAAAVTRLAGQPPRGRCMIGV